MLKMADAFEARAAALSHCFPEPISRKTQSGGLLFSIKAPLAAAALIRACHSAGPGQNRSVPGVQLHLWPPIRRPSISSLNWSRIEGP